MRDFIIITSMLVAAGTGIAGVVIAKLLFARIGFVFATVCMCVGLAYFGWLPLFGGSHDPGTYYGSVMLLGGMTAFILFAALDQMARQRKAA